MGHEMFVVRNEFLNETFYLICIHNIVRGYVPYINMDKGENCAKKHVLIALKFKYCDIFCYKKYY